MTVDPVALSRAYPGALWKNEIRGVSLPEVELAARVHSRIERLRQCWQDHRTERDQAEESTRFLEEDQGQWLVKNPGESEDHWKQKPKITVDLANKVLRDVATVYQTAPRRLVSGDIPDPQKDEAQEWLDEHVWSFGVDGLDATLLDLDRWLLFHGTIALEPRYQPDLDGLGVGGIEAIYYRRHEFEALPFDDDPRRAEAVVFPVRRIDKRNSQSRVTESEQVFHYWDQEVFARLKDWKIDPIPQVEDDPRTQAGVLVHDLGYLPVVFMKERVTQRCFYSPPVFPNLVRTCKSLNKLKTELAYFSMVPGSWYTDGTIENASMGPDAITEGTAGQQFDFRRMDANLAEIRANIQREIDDLGVAFGLSPGSLVMDPAAARSGVAIQSEQRDTDALRQERVPKWRRWEQRYHRAALDIYSFQSGTDTVPAVLVSDSGPPAATVDTIHARPQTMLSSTETRERLSWERQNGLTSPEDMLAESRDDLTEQEQQARLERAQPRALATPTPPPVPDTEDEESQDD